MANSPGFVVIPSREGRRLTWTSLEEHIKYTLKAALLTQIGEREARPEVGSRLRDFLFRPLVAGLKMEIKREIEETIRRNEPRVELIEVTLSSDAMDKSKFLVHLKYRIPQLQKVDQLRMTLEA